MKRFLLLFVGLFCLSLTLEFSACRKTFLTNPSTKLVDSDLSSSDGGAQMVLNGVYRLLRTTEGGDNPPHYNFGIPAMCLATDLMSNSMAISRQSWFAYFYNYQAILLATSDRVLNFFNRLYRIIANVNSVLDNNPQPRQKGQALALRAYAYLWLVNMYADHWKDSSSPILPLSLKANRSTTPADLANTATIYHQIVADLNASIEAFRQTGEDREQKSQIDISVAHGLLARTYLYLANYQGALDEATKALGGKNGSAFDGKDLMDSSAFKAGFNNIDNDEWMWGLATNVQQTGYYASISSMLDPTAQGYAGLGAYKCMSKTLYDTMQATDVRRQVICPPKANIKGKFGLNDISTNADYVQLKFRDPNSSWTTAQQFIKDRKSNIITGSFTASFPLMRKAEMYLIAAEACYRIGNSGGTNGANMALQKLREKRGHHNGSNSNCTADTVVLERRKELWGEGFALFDLKRLKKPMDRSKDSVHIALKGVNQGVLFISANSDSLTFYVPRKEIANDPQYNGRQPINRN